MKAAIKKILPVPLLNQVRDIRSRAGLAAVAKQNFSASNLNTGINTAAIFGDPSLVSRWENDQNAIAKILGDVDGGGSMNPGDRRALYMLISGLTPKNVLEIGTYAGVSTLYIAMALKSAGQGGRAVTVDILDVNQPSAPWKQSGLARPPKASASQLECGKTIEFIASAALPYMQATGTKFDFIFLDGDHAAPAVYREVAAALEILAPGGVILLHDYYPAAEALFPDGNAIAGPFRALDRVINENPDIKVQPLGALPWPTKQGSTMTSLALVTRRA